MRIPVPVLVCVACAACSVVPAPEASGGAWTRPQGSTYLEFETAGARAERELDHRGDSRPLFADRLNFVDARYEEVRSSIYVEHGLRSHLTLVGRFGARYAESVRTETGGSYFGGFRNNTWALGPADLHLGARAALLRRSTRLSLEVQAKVPLGYDGTPDDGTPPLGSGEFDFDARLRAGRSLAAGAWVEADAGYRLRGGPYHDEALYGLGGGIRLGAWMAQAAIEGVESVVEPEDLAGGPLELPLPGGGGVFPILVGDQNWTKTRFSLSRRLGATWLKVSVSDVVAGRNTLDALELALSVVVDREGG